MVVLYKISDLLTPVRCIGVGDHVQAFGGLANTSAKPYRMKHGC
jgi:hypothetical protein